MKKKLAKKAFQRIKKQLMDTTSDPNRNQQKAHADTIIRNHVIWSMGAGLIPVMVADILAVSALQIDMIRQLCKVYNVDFSETQGKAIVTSLTSTTLARVGAGSLAKMIPVVGSLVGGMAVSVFAGASTYALGEVFKQHFSSGGTILDFDPARLKKVYKEQFEKGKQMAEELRKQKEKPAATPFPEAHDPVVADTPEAIYEDGPSTIPSTPANETDATLRRLQELGNLKEKGLITEEEFAALKKKIVS